jgi:hypothetical protein
MLAANIRGETPTSFQRVTFVGLGTSRETALARWVHSRKVPLRAVFKT